MTVSRRKRRVRKERRRWRARTGNTECKDCGSDLRNTIHHYYCNECWNARKEWKREHPHQTYVYRQNRERERYRDVGDGSK